MADEEEQVTKSEFLSSSPNTLIAWESIQLPSIPHQFHSHSPILLLSDPHQVKPIWSTPPVNRNSDIFPPTNHENLNTNHQVDVLEKTCNEIVGPTPVKWWDSVKGLFRLFDFRIFGSTVLMLVLYLRFRRRLRRRNDELNRVIKAKDERIQRLLYQIARMNELLLAKHHGVPMISKAVSS